MRTYGIKWAALLVALAGCAEEAPLVVYEAVPVSTRDIVVAVRATGSILPDTVVEVKSKASGEILEMRVETGQEVRRGQLLVKIDQRVPRNRLAEAESQLKVIKARLSTAESQLRRSEELFKSKSITEQEYENATLAVANANAEVVRGEVAVETARIAMEDTDVLAPINGTIITKSVERGQVISSPTSDVGGGSILLTMADLNLVQVRTLVDEVDIGKIRPGLRATVTVNAYPNQPFQGQVLKIEPKAETAQNVTMFPVIIRVENRQGLLKPGMNAEVQVHIGQRQGVLAIPNAALRTERDVGSAAMVLGLGDEQLQAMLVTARAVRDSAAALARDSAARAATLASAGGGDSAAAPKAPAGNTMEFMGRTITLPEGVTEAQVTAAMGRFRQQQATADDRALMQKLRGPGGGGPGGMGGGPGGGPPRQSSVDFQFGGTYLVFVNRGGGPTPVYVRTGLTDLDYSEIVSGLTAQDSVLMLPSASLIQQQEDWRNRMQRMSGGSGVPGMQQQTGGQTGGARPGGGTPPAAPAAPPGGGRP